MELAVTNPYEIDMYIMKYTIHIVYHLLVSPIGINISPIGYSLFPIGYSLLLLTTLCWLEDGAHEISSTLRVPYLASPGKTLSATVA